MHLFNVDLGNSALGGGGGGGGVDQNDALKRSITEYRT